VDAGGCAGCDCPCHEDVAPDIDSGDETQSLLDVLLVAQTVNELLHLRPRVFPDGRCVRLQMQVSDTWLLTVSESVEAGGYLDGW
jgi:hypothetical protein